MVVVLELTSFNLVGTTAWIDIKVSKKRVHPNSLCTLSRSHPEGVRVESRSKSIEPEDPQSSLLASIKPFFCRSVLVTWNACFAVSVELKGNHKGAKTALHNCELGNKRPRSSATILALLLE